VFEFEQRSRVSKALRLKPLVFGRVFTHALAQTKKRVRIRTRICVLEALSLALRGSRQVGSRRSDRRAGFAALSCVPSRRQGCVRIGRAPRKMADDASRRRNNNWRPFGAKTPGTPLALTTKRGRLTCMGGVGVAQGLCRISCRIVVGGLLGGLLMGGACGGRAHGDASTSATGDGGASGGRAHGDASPSATGDGGASGALGAGSCGDEEQAARAAFAEVVLANGDCHTDADCARVAVGADCVAGCGVHVNTAGVSAVQAAAAQLCRSFDSQGCVPPSMSCPPPGVVGCHAGKCAEI
jgi:hypothetical protein